MTGLDQNFTPTTANQVLGFTYTNAGHGDHADGFLGFEDQADKEDEQDRDLDREYGCADKQERYDDLAHGQCCPAGARKAMAAPKDER